MPYLRKHIPASVASIVIGVLAGAVFGPSAGTMAAAEVSRRWMHGR